MMGHDARLRGKLIRAHLTGTPVSFLVGGTATRPEGVDLPSVESDAAAHAAEFFGESFVKALEQAELKRDGKRRELVANALNSKRLIKVGRWEYTGDVVAIFDTPSGKEFDIEYLTKMGERKRVRVPADRAKEVAA
jgi:hypothetical protein